MVAMYVALVPLHTQDGANHRQVAVLLERLISADVQDPVYQPNLGLLRTNVLFSGGYALAAATLGIPIHVYERLFVGAFLLLLLVGSRVFVSEWPPHRPHPLDHDDDQVDGESAGPKSPLRRRGRGKSGRFSHGGQRGARLARSVRRHERGGAELRRSAPRSSGRAQQPNHRPTHRPHAG